jgi:hypothetical protein
MKSNGNNVSTYYEFESQLVNLLTGTFFFFFFLFFFVAAGGSVGIDVAYVYMRGQKQIG